jgi:glycogenin glucosyltransferase
MPNAWITLATNDGYAVGALVLAHSLKQVGTQHDIHVMYTDGVSIPLRFVIHFEISLFVY